MDYKLGELIKITKRKCSDKIQPKIKVGGLYLIIEEGKPTKSGARVLRIAEFYKMAEMAITNPTKHINPKDIMHCNSDRFEWIKKSPTQLKAEFKRVKDDYFREQENRQDEEIKNKFTEKERIQMAYTPYLYAELSWHYANKVISLAAERKIPELKKLTRTVRMLREKFLSELRVKMSQPVLQAAQEKVKKAIEEHFLDFFKFEMSVQNEVNRQYVQIDHDDIRTYAYISMLCYESQQKVDRANFLLIHSRLGALSTEHDSYKYMKELYACMDAYMGDCKMENTLTIQTAVKVMEKNINQMEL